MSDVVFYGSTNIGLVRTNNEDAYVVRNIWDENHILAVAIDGVGGYDGGEVASSMARDCIVEYLETYSNGECVDLLKQAVINANNVIFSERQNQPQYNQMSCVLTAILVEVEKRRVNMVHVGDTRLYQYADGIFKKISHDHSLVGFREEIGQLTEEEAMNHPQRNVISKDLGSSFLENSGNNYLEVETFPLIPQSLLLLCSDGLNDMLTSLQIVTELENGKTVQEKVDLLIKAANDTGGKDNITVVIVESRLQDDNASVAENELIEHSVMDDFAEGQIAESNNRKNLVEHILVICAVLIFVVGYTLGGCTGNVIFPSLFSDGGDKDAQTISRLDSLIIDLKNDTTELKHTINEQESLIIALKDSLRRK